MYWQEKEAKKEAFRKYLESSGVLDALTKGLSFIDVKLNPVVFFVRRLDLFIYKSMCIFIQSVFFFFCIFWDSFGCIVRAK